MSATMDEFIPMAGPVRTIYETLSGLVGIESFECGCKHVKKCADSNCGHEEPIATFTGLEEAANRIVGMIERGELA